MEKVELSRLVEKLESGSREKGGSVDSGIISIGGTHLSTTGGFKWDKKEFISEDFFQKMRNGKIQTDDILIVKDGATTGKVSYVDKNFPFTNAAINEHVFKLQINQQLANPKYIFYFLYSAYGQEQILNDFRGATIGGISRGFIDKVEVPLPDLEAQNKIVNILDKVKAIIDKRKETIQKYDELLRATFLDMFGDVPNNPKGLDKKALKEFGKIITGNTPPRNNANNYNSRFVEWIKTDNIISRSHALTPAAEFLSEEGFKKARYVEKDSLLVACIAGSIGSIGRSAITDRRVAFNQQINAVEPNKDVSIFFLYWMFKVSQKYIQSHATKGMKRLITKGEFEKILFLKPDYKEQLKFEKIASHYSNCQSNVLYFQHQAEILLKSLSQQVFNEKIIIDIDAELDSLINAIDLEKKDEDNNIETILKDITFTQRLIDKLDQQEFENKDQYDKAKYILFRIMREAENLVKQIYKDSKVQLTLLNETT